MKYIKTINERWIEINEALDNPLEIKWIDKDFEISGFFTLNKSAYNIRCINKGDNIWTYKFYKFDDKEQKLSPDLSNDKKNVFRVLPTIKIGFDYIINLKNPDALIFGALDKSEGRKKLYNSFCEELIKNYDYKYTTNRKEDRQIFILYKPSIDENILMNKVEEIILEEIDI